MKANPTSKQFFENKYRDNPDPWNFLLSQYEQARYQTTVDALKQQHFQRAFEPGCSIGVLTAHLASLCDQVEATEIAPTAARLARARCRNLTNVRIVLGALPEVIPAGTFDLIVFSEIGYYFDEKELIQLGSKLVSRLRQPGTLLAVHWLGQSNDHVLSGDQVHQILASLDGLVHQHAERHTGFRLDRWTRP